MIKKTVSSLLTVLFFATLVGCNTMEGAGKDMERGGEKIQEKAN